MTQYMMGLHKHIPGIILFIKYTGVLPHPLEKEETTQYNMQISFVKGISEQQNMACNKTPSLAIILVLSFEFVLYYCVSFRFSFRFALF